MTSSLTVSLQQARKPYTITKQRERWTEEEHSKFLEALKLYGRAWRRIEEYVGTKTAVQIRSHAQKFFCKLEREQASGTIQSGHDIEVPPPRPKRKPSHPYPKKAGGSSPVSPRPQSSGSPSDCSSRPLLRTSPSSTSLKLFGQTVHVASPACDEEQPSSSSLPSEGDSGVTYAPCAARQEVLLEASSCCPEQQQEVQQQQLDASNNMVLVTQQLVAAAARMQQEEPVSMNNLIALHYATLLAGIANNNGFNFRCPSPWQLVLGEQQNNKQQQEQQRQQQQQEQRQQQQQQQHNSCQQEQQLRKLHSISGSNFASSSGKLTRSIGCKRPHPAENKQACERNAKRRSDARSVCLDNDDSCSNTTLTLQRGDNDPRIGGFVPYARPSLPADLIM